MVEQVLRTLLHPRLVMTSLALLAFYSGLINLLYRPGYVHLPVVWAVLAMVAGAVGFAATLRPGRALVAASGAVLVVAFAGRAFALLEGALTIDLPDSHPLRASIAIAIAQWMTLSYITWVVWRRLAVPWSVLEQEQRLR